MRQHFWTVGGGKGGVGKSFLTASMGVVLSRMNKSVVVVDADLGSSNLHTFLGIRSPERTLLDLADGALSAEEVLLTTSEPNLRLLSCARDILGIADSTSSRRESLMNFLAGLRADYIVVDIGAGSSAGVVDFFNMSDQGIVVVSPDPASMQSAYVFIKSAIFRRIGSTFADSAAVQAALRDFANGHDPKKPHTMMDLYDALCTNEPRLAEKVAAVVEGFRPLLIVNMAATDEEQRVAEILQSVCERFLNVSLRFCGLIKADARVRQATQRMAVLEFDDQEGVAASGVRQTVQRLLNGTDPAADDRSPVPATPVMGLTDSIELMGKELHIQTEDLGYTGRCITTQVFLNGRVIYSAKTQYPAGAQDPRDRSVVVELMRKQHFNVMREIESRKERVVMAG